MCVFGCEYAPAKKAVDWEGLDGDAGWVNRSIEQSTGRDQALRDSRRQHKNKHQKA